MTLLRRLGNHSRKNRLYRAFRELGRVIRTITLLRYLSEPQLLAAQGHPVDNDDLATITPYITHNIRRLGDLVLDLDPPDTVPTTRLDLEPRALFPGGPTA